MSDEATEQDRLLKRAQDLRAQGSVMTTCTLCGEQVEDDEALDHFQLLHSDEPTGRSIEEVVEASSLGTPEAKAARESVPEELGVALSLVASHHPTATGCYCGHWSYPGHMAKLIAERIAQARKATEEHMAGPTPPPCADHREVQHRDGKPPWCNACGWRHGVPAQPPMQLHVAEATP